MRQLSRVSANVFGLVLIFFSCASAALNDASAPGTIVRTESGYIQGVVEGKLVAFRGIPFAAPPLGPLRWRAPQRAARWDGIRDASKFGNVCPQINYNGFYAGREDCLVLNVYISASPNSKKQPVMVFFHGGGDKRGDTHQSPFNSPPLAEHGVVVVTAEYRVGIPGFLANKLLTAEGDGLSGYYGFMDQIAALQWVQRNIRRFGGDPHHVMAFGQSAGSGGINILLTVPSAKGLFSVAGMESGAIPLGAQPSLAETEAASGPFVSYFHCDTAPDVLACMRAIPVHKIVIYQQQNPSMILGKAVGTSFLPEDPFLFLQQNGSPVPLLIGTTREEAAGTGDPVSGVSASQYPADLENEYPFFSPDIVNEIVNVLYPITDYDSPAYALIAVDSDYQYTCEVRNLARAAAGPGRQPVWRYLYTHRFENDPIENAYRAFHTAELYFVFGNMHLILTPGAIIYTPTPAERTFSDDLMGYWTRFAATGNPNGDGATVWPSYDASSDSMLQLDETFTAIDGYHNPQCDFLSTLPQL